MSWSLLEGFSEQFNTQFTPSYNAPSFTVACATYSADVYVVPSIKKHPPPSRNFSLITLAINLEIWHFLNLFISPTPHMWLDRMFPPPVDTFHGTQVDCLCTTADPNAPKHGYSAISAGIDTELGLSITKTALSSSTTIPIETVLDSSCWQSNCGPCYCPSSSSPSKSSRYSSNATAMAPLPPGPSFRHTATKIESKLGVAGNKSMSQDNAWVREQRDYTSGCSYYNPCQSKGMFECCSSYDGILSSWACCCLSQNGVCCGNSILDFRFPPPPPIISVALHDVNS